MAKPRIVIVGAGFGGMYVAKRFTRLSRRGLADVTIINRTNYFLFTPLLHEVATGSLDPNSVAEPIREIFRGSKMHVIQGTVTSVNTEKRMVTVNGEADTTAVPYDYLVLSTGAESNFYGIPGADTNTYGLKDLSDAARIRSRVIDTFELAVLAESPLDRQELLSFAVVGGGATGVEVCAELAEFVNGMVKRYYRSNDKKPGEAGQCRHEETSVTLVHTGPELLEMFPKSLREAAERRLVKSGVHLKLNSKVTEVTPAGLKLADGSMVKARTVIWAAGVKAVIPAFEGKTPALVGGRIATDQYFRMMGDQRVFVLGDAGAYVDPHAFAADSTKSKPLPMLAQVAVKQAACVAANVVASIQNEPLANFHYHTNGSMVSVGQWFAVGEIRSMDIAGFFTWWLWRAVYLMKFASWQKRTRIAIDWALDFFYPRDITKI